MAHEPAGRDVAILVNGRRQNAAALLKKIFGIVGASAKKTDANRRAGNDHTRKAPAWRKMLGFEQVWKNFTHLTSTNFGRASTLEANRTDAEYICGWTLIAGDD